MPFRMIPPFKPKNATTGIYLILNGIVEGEHTPPPGKKTVTSVQHAV
jgi:hypothetical protein